MADCLTQEDIESIIAIKFKERKNVSIRKYDPLELMENPEALQGLFSKDGMKKALNNIKDILGRADIFLPFASIIETNMNEDVKKFFSSNDPRDIRNRSIALTTIVGLQRSYKDIVRNNRINSSEIIDEATNTYHMDARNLEQTIGMNIAKSMGMVTQKLSKTERAEVYAKIGKTVLNQLINDGFINKEADKKVPYNKQYNATADVYADRQSGNYSTKSTYEASEVYNISADLLGDSTIANEYLFSKEKREDRRASSFTKTAEVARGINKISSPSYNKAPLSKAMTKEEYLDFLRENADIESMNTEKLDVLYKIHSTPLFINKIMIPILQDVHSRVKEGETVSSAIKNLSKRDRTIVDDFLGRVVGNERYFDSLSDSTSGKERTAYNNITDVIYNLDSFIDEKGEAKSLYFTPVSIRTDRTFFYENVLNFQYDKKFSRQILTGTNNPDTATFSKLDKDGKETKQWKTFLASFVDIGVNPSFIKEILENKEFANALVKIVEDKSTSLESAYALVNSYKSKGWLSPKLSGIHEGLRILAGLSDLAKSYGKDKITTYMTTGPDASNSGILIKSLYTIGDPESGSKDLLQQINLGLESDKELGTFKDFYGYIQKDLDNAFKQKIDETGDPLVAELYDIESNTIKKAKHVFEILQKFDIDQREFVKQAVMTVGAYSQTVGAASTSSIQNFLDTIFKKLNSKNLPLFQDLLKEDGILHGDDSISNTTRELFPSMSFEEFKRHPKAKEFLEDVLSNTAGKFLANRADDLIGEKLFGSLHKDLRELFNVLSENNVSLSDLKILPPSAVDGKTNEELTLNYLRKYGMSLTSKREAITKDGYTIQIDVPNIYTLLVNAIHATDAWGQLKSISKTIKTVGDKWSGIGTVHDASYAHPNVNAQNELDYTETILELTRDYNIVNEVLRTIDLLKLPTNEKIEAIREKAKQQQQMKEDLINNYMKNSKQYKDMREDSLNDSVYGFKKSQFESIKEAKPLSSKTSKKIEDDPLDTLAEESPFQKADNTGPKTPVDKVLYNKIKDKLMKLYPNINLKEMTLEDGILGKANLEALEVLVDKDRQQQDTLPHEYAHQYINMFKNSPIVKEAIKKWGNEEALVQAIGEQVVKQQGEAYGWWKKFTNIVRQLLQNLTNQDKETLKNLLTDALLENKDLTNLKDESWRPSYSEYIGESSSTDIFSELSYSANQYVVDTLITRTELFGKVLNDRVLSEWHKKLLNTNPMYKEVFEFLQDVKNSETVSSTLEWLNISDFKDKKNKNDLISYIHRLGQEKNKITSSYVKDLDDILKLSFTTPEGSPDKAFIASIDDIYSRSGIHFLIESDPALYHDLSTGKKSIEEVMKNYETKVPKALQGIAKNLSSMFIEGKVEGNYRLDNFDGVNMKYRQDVAILTSLYSLQKIPNAESNLKKFRSVDKAHDKVITALQATIAMHKKLYELTGDSASYRGNLTHDYFEHNYQFQMVTAEQLSKGILSKDNRWKILRKPEKGGYGIIYKRSDFSAQQGLGTDVSYNIDGLVLPNTNMRDAEDIMKRNNGVRVKIGSQENIKTILTKEEKETLGLVKSPAQTLIRTYAHLKFIAESQVIRDELVTKEYVHTIKTKEDADALVEKMKDKEIDFSWFIKLEGFSYSDLPKEITSRYKGAERITNIKGMADKISLVRKDIAHWVVGYDDVDIFSNSPALNKASMFIRKAVIMTKINWVVNNPVKLAMDLTSNYTYLLSLGVPPLDIYKNSVEGLKELKDLERLRGEIVASKFLVDANPKDTKEQSRLNMLQNRLKTHPLATIYYNGMIQSLSTDIILKDYDTISGLQHDLVEAIDKIVRNNKGELNSIGDFILRMSRYGVRVEDTLDMLSSKLPDGKVTGSVKEWMSNTAKNISVMKKEEDVSTYITQFMGAPGSEITKLGSAIMQYSDVIPRIVLYRHHKNRGLNEDKAILNTLESFIDYKVNMPKELKALSDYGILLFPSFWARIQKVIFNLAKNHPVNFASAYVFNELFGSSGIHIMDQNIFSKFDNGIFHTPPVGLDSILPTNLIPGL